MSDQFYVSDQWNKSLSSHISSPTAELIYAYKVISNSFRLTCVIPVDTGTTKQRE